MPSFSVSGMHRAVVLAAVPLLAVVFAPGLHSAFLVPKTFVMILLTAALLIWQWPSVMHARAFWIAVIVWLVILLCSGVQSSYPELRTDALAFAVSGPLLLLGTQRILRQNSDTWQNALVATGALIALIVIAQSLGSVDLFRLFGTESALVGRMRAFGTLGNPLFAGVFLAPMLVIANARAQTKQERWMFAAAFLIATGLAVTGSRTALVAAALGLLLMTASASLRNSAAVLLLIGVVFSFGTKFSSRSVADATQGRLFISRVSLVGGISFLGSGPGTFAVTYPAKVSNYFGEGNHKDEYRFAGYERHAHNDWTEALSENGMLGLTAFAAIFVAWLGALRREPLTSPRRTAVAVVATLLVASFADFTFHRADTWALLWMAMGAALPFAPASANPPPYMWVPRISLAALLVWTALPPVFASRALVLGADAEAAGNPVRATAQYEAALRWQPASPDANFNLTRVLCKQGALDACWTRSERARRYVDEAELYVLRARCLEAQGRFLEAGVELARARERFPFSKSLAH